MPWAALPLCLAKEARSSGSGGRASTATSMVCNCSHMRVAVTFRVTAAFRVAVVGVQGLLDLPSCSAAYRETDGRLYSQRIDLLMQEWNEGIIINQAAQTTTTIPLRDLESNHVVNRGAGGWRNGDAMRQAVRRRKVLIDEVERRTAVLLAATATASAPTAASSSAAAATQKQAINELFSDALWAAGGKPTKSWATRSPRAVVDWLTKSND